MSKFQVAQHRPNSRFPLGLLLTIFLTIGTAVLIGIFSTPSALAEPTNQMMKLESLIRQVKETGTVRVIVGLNTSFTPEGKLAGSLAAKIQQEDIRQAQNYVVNQLKGTNYTLHAQYKYIPYMALSVDEPALERLMLSPEINFIKEDSLSVVSLASSIPVIGADTAWASGYSGSGQTIAILDTGVDKTHSFFSGGKVVSEACYSSTGFLNNDPQKPYNSVCPGGVLESTAPGSGIDCIAATTGYPTAQNDCRHGTHVAGIAAGNGGGGPNIGVAKDAHLIAVQVFTLFNYFGGIASFSSDQIKGLERIYDLRNTYDIAAVNMSLGSATLFSTICDGSDPERKAAIDNLRSVGITTIVATGNDSSTTGIAAPACISSAVSVGASYDWDTITSFSNVAPIIDFLAPGYDITSSIPGGGTISWPGTSMATPHVAGAWAVARSLSPDATVDELLTAFKNTGTLIDDTRSGGTVQDIPRINVDQAISGLNQAPVAVNDGAATPLNTAVTINVLTNDYDPENQTISLIDVDSPPGHGSAIKVSSTSIQYSPTGGYSGADSFTYTIQDEFNREATGSVVIIIDGESIFLPTILK